MYSFTTLGWWRHGLDSREGSAISFHKSMKGSEQEHTFGGRTDFLFGVHNLCLFLIPSPFQKTQSPRVPTSCLPCWSSPCCLSSAFCWPGTSSGNVPVTGWGSVCVCVLPDRARAKVTSPFLSPISRGRSLQSGNEPLAVVHASRWPQ